MGIKIKNMVNRVLRILSPSFCKLLQIEEENKKLKADLKSLNSKVEKRFNELIEEVKNLAGENKDTSNHIKNLAAANEKAENDYNNFITIAGIEFEKARNRIDQHKKSIDKQNKEISKTIKTDLNIMFKYMSEGLELHPYNGILHRIITADYREAKENHFLRYKYASTLIEKSNDVLDIACGVGYGCSLIRHETQAARVVGVDLSKSSIVFAKKVFAEENIDFFQGDCVDLQLFPFESFDRIISFETIEHICEDEQFLTNVYRWLKRGGVFIGSVPNEDVIPYNKEKYPHHFKHYTKNGLENLLKTSGFNIRQFTYGDWKIVPTEQASYTFIFVCEKK